MKFCKLINGSIVPQLRVMTSWTTIKSLAESGGLNEKRSLYELIRKAQDVKYKIADPELAKILKDHALLSHDENIYIITKNIVQSAISINDGVFCIGDPIVSMCEEEF